MIRLFYPIILFTIVYTFIACGVNDEFEQKKCSVETCDDCHEIENVVSIYMDKDKLTIMHNDIESNQGANIDCDLEVEIIYLETN